MNTNPLITMNKMKYLLVGLLATGIVVTTFVSCGEDEPVALTIKTVTAGSIDLNGATSPTGVPVNPTITATFSTQIDAATAVAANIQLVRDYDDAELELDIEVNGATITISPADDLGTGTLYELKFGAALASKEGKTLTAASRTFTTEGTFAPAGVLAHFTFENNANDVVGAFDPSASDIVDLTFVDSRKAAAGKAGSFNGTTSLVEIPNADQFLGNNDFTVSFWVKANSTKNGHFVFGLAAWYGFQFEIAGDWAWAKLALRYKQGDNTNDAEDSWFPGNGQTKDNGGWQGWTFQKDVSASGGVGDTYFKDKWAHVVVTYNAATKLNTMYINGEKVKEHDFDLWPNDAKKKTITGVTFAGNATGDKLALGYIQGRENRIVTDDWANYATGNGHFKGLLDDIRFFSKSITATEVSLMYNSEKP